jgi:hypothetical protein
VFAYISKIFLEFFKCLKFLSVSLYKNFPARAFRSLMLYFLHTSSLDAVLNLTNFSSPHHDATPRAQFTLIGADCLVIAEDWDKKNLGPPQLMGQLFHYFEAPNRSGLKAFYTLRVWAWKDNPNGAFVNWHPNVSCYAFNGQSPE